MFNNKNLYTKEEADNYDKLIINNIKSLGIDMINEANSGHPGIVLGAAPIMYTLMSRHINFTHTDATWISRDRFILSAGHGSALLYSTLFMAGFNYSIDDLKNFRVINSITPGHPELDVKRGIEMSTGPLGQGIASSVGIALGEKISSTKFNQNNMKIIDHHTYVLVGDGDLMEGLSTEAASLAGTLKLGKLIVLYDSNNISLDGSTSMTFTENVLEKFSSLGWHTSLVKNGEDINEIDSAISKAKNVGDKPSIIEIKTIIGKGSYEEGTNGIHGTPLKEKDYNNFKTNIGFSESFYVDTAAKEYFRSNIALRTSKVYDEWCSIYNKYMNEVNDILKSEFLKFYRRERDEINISSLIEAFPGNLKEATRVTSGRVLNALSKNMPFLIGGSADISSSTKTYLLDYADVIADNYNGKNIWYGVREHAMASLSNGLSLYGFRPFCSTFLVFSDYLKPSIRLSCLMNLPVIYVFTHDSVLVGEDGPTHEPIEQLTMLRSIPNFDVYRPADANEVVGAYNEIINKNKPAAIVLSRSDVNLIQTTNPDMVKYGAYIVRREISKLDAVVIASGTEVSFALEVVNNLYREGLDIRVVSMPNMGLFDAMPEDYKNKILPDGIKVFTIELGSKMPWYKYAKDPFIFGTDEFGKSGKPNDVLKEVGLDYKTIYDKIKEII